MKKLLTCLLACTLLLSACSGSPIRVRDLDKDDDDKDSFRYPFAETAIETRAPLATEAPDASVEVRYNRYVEGGSEYAAIQGFDGDGNQLWVVTTALLPLSQLQRVTDIGRFEDRYYYIEDGAVVALNVADGSVLWKNTEFRGAPLEDCVFIGETGRIYLSGYFGPDIAVIEPDGRTAMLSALSDEYFWPCRLEVDEAAGVATVHMSAGPEGDTSGGDTYPITVDIP